LGYGASAFFLRSTAQIGQAIRAPLSGVSADRFQVFVSQSFIDVAKYKTAKAHIAFRNLFKVRKRIPVINQSSRHCLAISLRDSAIVALSVLLIPAVEVFPRA
jgi:hypothetical protein